MVNAIEVGVVPDSDLPEDVSDIVFYIKGLYGLNSFETLPISVGFICEMHKYHSYLKLFQNGNE